MSAGRFARVLGAISVSSGGIALVPGAISGSTGGIALVPGAVGVSAGGIALVPGAAVGRGRMCRPRRGPTHVMTAAHDGFGATAQYKNYKKL